MSNIPPVLPTNSGGSYYPPPPPPRRGGGIGRLFFWAVLLASLGLNVLICGGVVSLAAGTSADGTPRVTERFIAGNSMADDKIAVIRLEGAIVEGMLSYVHKQIEEAARDNSVKAVVLRVESPGGSITASDDLLYRLGQLRDGKTPKYKNQSNPKPIVVSMGSVAASGGYYVAMAAATDPTKPAQKKLFAERTTITGSIGVYASLPNAKGTAEKVGFKMEMIKAGDIKGSGSPFHEMTPSERQPWQDMVDSAYRQFIEVVETGRPELKDKLTEPLFEPKKVARFDDRGNQIGEDGGSYTRKRADGGIFTAREAVEYKLIDAVGTLDDAVAEVATQAGIADYRVVQYDKPLTLLTVLTGANSPAPPSGLELLPYLDLSPRLWYLLPHSEPAARLTH